MICIADLPEELATLQAHYTSEYFPRLAKFKDPFVPFLDDYSGDYDTVYRNSETGQEGIYNFDHEDEVDSPILLHRDKLDLVKTHLELFARGIYFLGDNGRLETDYAAEKSLVAKMNPGVSYWTS